MQITKQSNKKRPKLLDGDQNMPSVDRLSGLPDSVLCHILSFLTTRVSVKTSILARRWRFLWAYVPNLDFEGNCRNYKFNGGFSDIINRVLLLHKVQSISTFCLSDVNDDDCTEYQLDSWIAAAISRNVQNLDLHVRKRIMLLPRGLFTCKTLVDLKLSIWHVRIPFIDNVCLPSLKKLHFDSVQYEVDEALPQLLSGCPVLEVFVSRIVLDKDHMVCCHISSPRINSLSVNLQYEADESFSHDFRVEINVPTLGYLKVEDWSTEHIKSGALTSLVEADICLCNYHYKKDNFLYSQSTLEFVDKLCNIKCLKLDLSIGTKIVDSIFSAWNTRFHNLTKLKLIAECRFLSKFLEISDNLETLDFSEACDELKVWKEPQQVPTSLLSHLTTITINDFTCADYEHEMIKYLLRNAKVLKRMNIYCPSDGIDLESKFNGLQRISLFERGSEACQLAFF